MAFNDVQIANMALIELGKPEITSFSEASPHARQMQLVYAPTVQEILRTHPWRCCRAKQVLADDPDATPAFGFSNACGLPADFMKVVKVNDNIDKFEIVGKHLHIDDDAPQLTYTAHKSADYFDAALVSAIVARLVWRLCRPLTDAPVTEVEQRKKTYMELLADARLADALDGAPEEQPISTWLQDRISEA